MKPPHRLAPLGLAVLAYSLPALGHHSFPVLLTADGEEVIDALEGTVRVFRIVNPHGALILDVSDESGGTEGWLIELSPASQLAREGWTDGMLDAGDRIRVSVFRSRTPNRGRLRAILAYGKTDAEAARLFVSYGIRGDTPIMRRLRERVPTCGTIDASYQRTECFLLDADALRSLEEEFPGPMGYVLP
jgi:hypothetical protein